MFETYIIYIFFFQFGILDIKHIHIHTLTNIHTYTRVHRNSPCNYTDTVNIYMVNIMIDTIRCEKNKNK